MGKSLSAGRATGAGRSCGDEEDSVARTILEACVPHALQRPSRCGAEPGPMFSEGSERWAPALQRTVEGTLRCVRGTDNLDRFFKQWTHLLALAAHLARALLRCVALIKDKGAGKAGRRLAPVSPCAKRCTRGGPQVSRTPGLPCATVYGVLRALPGERCTIAPVALRMTDARTGWPPHHHRT